MRAYIYDKHGKLIETIYSIKRINDMRMEHDEFGYYTVVFYHTLNDMIEHNFYFYGSESVTFDNDIMVEG